ncbi:TetR/AcrR family transcriptional regulator [Streptomyces sp. NPDC054863]
MSENPQQPMGRRERSKQRVRENIYASALALFAEQGYDSTTVDQISERADVARGTFFNYFPRKEDLVTAWAAERQRKLQERMEKTMRDAPDDVTVHLELCMAALADFNEAERDVTPAMLTAWVKAGRPLMEEPYAGRIFADIIAAGQRSGQIAPGIDPLRVGNVVRDSYLGILYRWSQNPEGQAPLRMELRELLRVILTGVLSYAQRGWTSPSTSPAACPQDPEPAAGRAVTRPDS